jgi:hypothetical protein
MADQGVMTTPIFDELLNEFGSDLTAGDTAPESDSVQEHDKD